MRTEPKDHEQLCRGRDPAAREALGARSLRERAQREPRLSRDEEEKAAVRMVPRGTRLQRLLERALWACHPMLALLFGIMGGWEHNRHNRHNVA